MIVSGLAKLLGLESSDHRVIRGFAVDSRKIEEGFVFFALKGEKCDGHQFVKEVFDKGAYVAIIDKDFNKEYPGLPLFCVDDVLCTLQSLAKEKIRSSECKIIGITGSMGKTTTKEFSAALLSRKYRVYKTPGNANSQIGLPLAILNDLSQDDDIAVVEMGMTNRGHISKLVEIAPPDIAVITKIAPAHIEFFENGLEGIAEAKSEILSSFQTKLAYINTQASNFNPIENKKCDRKIYYGLNSKVSKDKNGYWLEAQGRKIRVCCLEEMGPWINISFFAPHLQENLLVAILIARHFSMTWEEISLGCERLEMAKGRFEFIERDGVTFINDCYNANPESMKAALSNLPSPINEGRVMAVLGHMVDLGDASTQLHADVGAFASSYVDKLFCLGEKCLSMKEAFAISGKPVEHFCDKDLMKRSLMNQLRKGDVVLIKASNSVALWSLLEDVK